MTDYQKEYTNPDLYDAEYGNYLPDGSFFESLLLPRDKTILDLACGTGRLAIPLAKKGFEVTGVEILAPMLDLARKKSSDLKIHWVEGDCTTFDLKTTFDLLIMGGNAFQAMLTTQDQRQLFKRVKKHLSAEGRFAFNMRTVTALLGESQTPTYWHTFTDVQGHKIDVYGYIECDETQSVATYTTERRGPDTSTKTKISLKFTSYGELKMLIESCGLKVIEIWGSADKEPYSETSESMYLVCGHLDS